MKSGFKLATLILVLVAAFSLSACEIPIDTDSTLYKNTEAMIEALVENDKDTARALLGEACSDEDFDEVYPTFVEVFGGIGEYEISGLGFNRGVKNGISYNNMTLLISTEKGELQIFVEERSDIPDVLSSFYVSEYNAAKAPDGSVIVGQIILLLLSIAELGFVIWMTVDCAKRKIRKKALWIILILLANVVFKLTVGAGKISFNLSLFFGISSLSVLNTGGFVISLSVPLGAILWLIMRDRIKPVEKPVLENRASDAATDSSLQEESVAQSNNIPTQNSDNKENIEE